MGRCHLESDLDRRSSDGIIGIVVLQMHERQRAAADMKPNRHHGRKYPQPPGSFLFGVEISHRNISATQGLRIDGLAASRAEGVPALSGPPSSATSLIFA